MRNIYDQLLERRASGKKSLAVLVDPDKTAQLPALLREAKNNPPDFFFVGGSLLDGGSLESCIAMIRNETDLPVVLFPGSTMQVSSSADAILLLSVISGRNADLLIGRHVLAAPMLKQSGLEIIPTGYVLVESGNLTTVAYISNTIPVPREKNSIAACTALAGEQLGLKLIYLEAGSGAEMPVPPSMIESVRAAVSVPLITGGGLRTKEEIAERCRAGADLVVVGNILEKSPALLPSFVEAVRLS
jgi:phosphoglycerol geranylgeranyltransferase